MTLESDRTIDELVDMYPDHPYKEWVKKEIAAKVFRGGPNPCHIHKLHKVDEDWAIHQMNLWELTRTLDEHGVFKHPATFWFDTLNERFENFQEHGYIIDDNWGFDPTCQVGWQEHFVRQSGRTTRRLLEGILELMEKRPGCEDVILYVPKYQTAKFLETEFKQLLSPLKPDLAAGLRFSTATNNRDLRGYAEHNTVIIKDHTFHYEEKIEQVRKRNDMEERYEKLQRTDGYDVRRDIERERSKLSEALEEITPIRPLTFESLH